MNTVTPQTAPSLESVWTLLQETAQLQKESSADFNRQLKKSEAKREKANADFDRQLKESRAKFDKELKESRADFDERMKRLDKLIGNIGNNNGLIAEEYFFNSFEKGKTNFFGEKFDEIVKNLTHFWQGLKDEYDIVMYNHTSVAIIEVKYKAHKSDIPDVLKKAETFRLIFPNYKDFKIYLGLATMAFYPELEQECIEQGIAVIKQVGETVIINDKHLKVF